MRRSTVALVQLMSIRTLGSQRNAAVEQQLAHTQDRVMQLHALDVPALSLHCSIRLEAALSLVPRSKSG
jgi:hypothetical protein